MNKKKPSKILKRTPKPSAAPRTARRYHIRGNAIHVHRDKFVNQAHTEAMAEAKQANDLHVRLVENLDNPTTRIAVWIDMLENENIRQGLNRLPLDERLTLEPFIKAYALGVSRSPVWAALPNSFAAFIEAICFTQYRSTLRDYLDATVKKIFKNTGVLIWEHEDTHSSVYRGPWEAMSHFFAWAIPDLVDDQQGRPPMMKNQLDLFLKLCTGYSLATNNPIATAKTQPYIDTEELDKLISRMGGIRLTSFFLNLKASEKKLLEPYFKAFVEARERSKKWQELEVTYLSFLYAIGQATTSDAVKNLAMTLIGDRVQGSQNRGRSPHIESDVVVALVHFFRFAAQKQAGNVKALENQPKFTSIARALWTKLATGLEDYYTELNLAKAKGKKL